MLDIIRQRLRIGSTAGTTTENVFGKLSNLVGHSIGDIDSCRDSRIGAQDDAALKGNGHDCRSCRHFTWLETLFIIRHVECTIVGVGNGSRHDKDAQGRFFAGILCLWRHALMRRDAAIEAKERRRRLPK